jgi:hypothetical protein
VQPCYTLAIIEDICDRKHQEKALSLIVEGTAAKTGNEFFRACAYYLRQIFDTSYAFVGSLVNSEPARIRTLAFCDATRISYQMLNITWLILPVKEYLRIRFIFAQQEYKKNFLTIGI